MTITEFLLARIAEDEAAARDCEQVFPLDEPFGLEFQHDHQSRWTPARVLAECETRRRIVDWLGHTIENEFGWDGMDWFVLKQLAAVYADHPDFDEAWRAA